jgi:ABC-type sugar transport system permease subunit
MNWKTFHKVEPYIFLAPFLVCFLVFFLWPILFSVGVSFTDWRGVHTGNYVGTKNFVEVLSSPTFSKALLNTLIYAAISGITLIPLGFIVAYILNLEIVKWKKLFRTVFFLPVAIPTVIMGSVFAVMYEWHYGILNYFLEILGFTRLNWLGDVRTAKVAVMITFNWRMIGLVMIYYIAGLQGLDESSIEAARIDGASGLQIILYITLPLLGPIIMFIGVVLSVEVFQIFQEPYILFSFTAMGASGGPEDSALSLLQYLHRLGFQYQHMGQASVVAIVIFALIITASLIQMKYFGFFRKE